eukprot:a341327_18.p1 GENE.a341327_18~~a341327_18.p1  ORF type:complete len:506 (+),score=190.78 a341327_18:136-1518(+)
MAAILAVVVHCLRQPSDLRMDLRERGGQFVNWEQRVHCRPASFVHVRSVEDIVEIVKAAAESGKKVRAVGAGHSWNDGACTDGTMISLDLMDKVLEIDKARGTVTVQGGIRFLVLQDALAEAGLSFPVLPSVPHQSAAGLIQTATHGNGAKHPCLSSLVVAVTVVTGTGQIVRVSESENRELLPAFRCALGALGIFVEITFAGLEPLFALTKVERPLSLDEALLALPGLLDSQPYFKLWYFPGTGRVQLSEFLRTAGETPTTDGVGTWISEVLVQQHIANLCLHAVSWARGALRKRLLSLVFGLGFKTGRRVNRSDKLFNIPVLIRHSENEFCYPVAQAEAAIRATVAIAEAQAPAVNFPIEIRFVAADNTWMSNNFERAGCHITCMAYNMQTDEFFTLVENEVCRSFDARPHWGKTTMTYGPDDYAQLYPRHGDFVALRNKCDPRRVFANAYTERILGQ